MEGSDEPQIVAFRERKDRGGNEHSSSCDDFTPERNIKTPQREIARLDGLVSQTAATFIDAQMAVLMEVIIPLMKHAPDDVLEDISQRMSSAETTAAFGGAAARPSRVWHEIARSILESRHSGGEPKK